MGGRGEEQRPQEMERLRGAVSHLRGFEGLF